MLLKEQQQRIELEKEKALLEEQQKKTQELKDRLTPENIEHKAKIESDIEKAKIRREDIEKDFWKRLASAESIQKLEGTVGHLTETEVWKIQLKKVKLKVRLRGLISAHSNVVSSYEIDPVLEEKCQTLKQNIYDVASCEMMIEMTIGQSSEQDEEEQGEEPLNLATQVPPPMSSTEIEFRERIDSMENYDEVPAHLSPRTINEREFYYLLMKRNRTVSDVETLNHMCGAVQAMGNSDVDTMDRYQAAKRKGTKIIQKCNELLDVLKVQISPSEPKGCPKEEVPRETPMKEETMKKKCEYRWHSELDCAGKKLVRPRWASNP